jgi:hypothetical protein
VALRFTLPVAGRARLAVYDVTGRCVRILLAGSLAAGEHQARWEARDDGGRPIATGLYFVRLETAGGARSRRVVVAR